MRQTVSKAASEPIFTWNRFIAINISKSPCWVAGVRLAYRLSSLETCMHRSRARASARPGATSLVGQLAELRSAKMDLQAGLVDPARSGARPQHVVLRGAVGGTAGDGIRPVI